MVTRRDLLKLMGLGLAHASISGCSNNVMNSMFGDRLSLSKYGPIDRTHGDKAPQKFTGDVPERPHSILWDKAEYLAKTKQMIPPAKEKFPLVIIGGGMSGLGVAYQLRHLKPVILEQATRFGGNSKGESWRGVDYGLGAAYMINPTGANPTVQLFKELGLSKKFAIKKEEGPVYLNWKRYEHFWEGETAPSAKKQFKKINEYMVALSRSEQGMTFPEYPTYDPAMRKIINNLDKVSFLSHLEKVVGGKLHSHIETLMEHYSWSSFATSSKELSAAAGLNFFAGEADEVAVFPGGNAYVAEALLSHLRDELPKKHLRTRCLVFDVTLENDGVLVTFLNQEDKLETIKAEKLVFSCPKFVVGKLLNGITTDRLNAIGDLRYHSYLVANLLIDKKVGEKHYDLFNLGAGKVGWDDLEKYSDLINATDIVNGNFATPHSDKSVLTLYRGIPYDGARPDLYAEDAYPRYRARFEKQVYDEILPAFNIGKSDLVDLRLTRWGHPLPCADVGLVAKGTIDRCFAPIKDRIYFVEQDNWMLPAFETVMAEVFHWSPIIGNGLA